MVQLAIMAARNQLKTLQVLQAGIVPADDVGGLRKRGARKSCGRTCNKVRLDGSNVPASACMLKDLKRERAEACNKRKSSTKHQQG